MTALLGAVVSARAGATPTAQDANTVSAGVFTDEQATRGSDMYKKACASCHVADLGGESFAPTLRGDVFSSHWQGATLHDLFKIIKDTMPADSPGSLTAPDAADLVAFLLKANGYKPGPRPLSSDPAILAA